ncbi:DUF481 domain-containing protein [Thalassobius sp. I31.1]|uniref:DUF481 domain-containing protein n=1 Tax=Thalassobius sp. I31.1 TaxID=2109912 RepID=UPI000D19FD6E|nr:DUF481 domain-containing protein [Thalassobius sp. I31.1]
MTQKTAKSVTLAALMIAGGTAAFAQDTGVQITNDAATDAVEAIETNINDDYERGYDADRFGNSRRPLGWRGSVAASMNATSGNSDTTDLGIGSRFGYGTENWDHDFTLSYNYSEKEGTRSANTFLGAYDASRYFNERFYGYGKLRYANDEFGAFEEDGFVGFGVGYRLIDNDNFHWRVQGGPGYRITQAQGADNSVREGAALLGSRMYWSLNDNVTLTNDTDVLSSSADTLVSNDLGVNVSLSGPLSLRTSVRTDYHTDPAAGQASTSNTFGVSLVYKFN